MRFFLKKRNTQAQELSEQESCDPKLLYNTYAAFSLINRLSLWRRIYQRYLKPDFFNGNARTYSLLDVGFGAGDIPIKLANWARQDGFELKILGIDIDRRAFEYVNNKYRDPHVSFRCAHTRDLIKENLKFDFVISNNVLHHLSNEELTDLLGDVTKIAKRLILINDIERSDLAYLAFKALTFSRFKNSFIVPDGLTSIKRSYTAGELKSVAPSEWRVTRMFPARLLLTYSFER